MPSGSQVLELYCRLHSTSIPYKQTLLLFEQQCAPPLPPYSYCCLYHPAGVNHIELQVQRWNFRESCLKDLCLFLLFLGIQ